MLPVEIGGTTDAHYLWTCTDAIDGNPFDGVNTTHLAVSMKVGAGSYQPIASWDGVYAGNYVTMQTAATEGNSSILSSWGNLQVTQVPEPSTLLLLAVACMGLGWFKPGKRKTSLP